MSFKFAATLAGKVRTSRREMFALLGLVLASTFACAGEPAAPGAPLGVGEKFPGLRAFSLEGRLPDMDSARVTIVDFWASWCAPCKASFPVYDALQKQFGERGLVIVAVSVDDDPRAMAAFVQRLKPSFTIVRDATKELVGAVRPPTMPTAFVLDRHGVVRFVHAGFHGEQSRAEYLAQIEALLSEKP